MFFIFECLVEHIYGLFMVEAYSVKLYLGIMLAKLQENGCLLRGFL